MGNQAGQWLVGFDDRVEHWLVVRTKPRQERNAVVHLWQRGVESYLPLLLEPPRYRRAPRGPVPMFASYLFVNCRPREQLSAVRFCPGILGPVVFDQHLATVGQDVIHALQRREDERGFVETEALPCGMSAGQKVQIMAGPLKGLEGVFERYLRSRHRVQLFMQFLRARNRVEVEAEVVAAVR